MFAVIQLAQLIFNSMDKIRTEEFLRKTKVRGNGLLGADVDAERIKVIRADDGTVVVHRAGGGQIAADEGHAE